MDLIELGEQIKQARRAARLSQSELAERAGVSRARIDAIENGRAPEAGLKLTLRMLRALGLDLRVTTHNDGRPTLEDLRREQTVSARKGAD